MPKLHIKYSLAGCDLYDQSLKISGDLLELKKEEKKITLSFPFEILEKPEKIIIGTKLYTGEILVDWTPWKILEVK